MDQSLNKEARPSIRFEEGLMGDVKKAAKVLSVARRRRVTVSDVVREATEKHVAKILKKRKLGLVAAA